jgi:hypothetical protein
MTRRLAFGLLLAAAATPLLAQGTSFRITVGTNEKNGVCYVYLPTDPNNLEGPELEISVLAETGNANIGIAKLPPKLASARLERRAPVKLKFAKGKTFKTDDGSYRAGYYYKHLGWWRDSKNGLPVLSALKDGTTVEVEFDGLKYGPIAIQQSPATMKNYGYNFLKACVKRNGGTAVF